MKLQAKTKRAAHELFLLAAGLLGWWTAASAASPAQWPSAASLLLPGLLFLVVVVGARLLAFPLSYEGGGALLSLDAAIFARIAG